MYKVQNKVAETKLNSWMSQEMPSMTTNRQEMIELNHSVSQDMPIMTASRQEKD